MKTGLLCLTMCLSTMCALLAGACGDEGLDGFDVVLLDDSSDEVLVTLDDAVARGEVTTDDTRAAQLLAPAEGAQLARDTPTTFSWQPPQTVKHGRSTGDYVWLRIDCAGMDLPIDVVSIETVAYTPDEARWAKIVASGGQCTATLTTAFVDRGIIQEGGPFQPSSAPSFSIAP